MCEIYVRKGEIGESVHWMRQTNGAVHSEHPGEVSKCDWVARVSCQCPRGHIMRICTNTHYLI